MYFCTRKSGLHLRSTWQRRNGMATARVRGPLILLQSESASSGRRKIASYNNCNVFKFDPNFHFYFNNILFNFYDGSFFGSKNICFIVRPLLVIENLKQKKNKSNYLCIFVHTSHSVTDNVSRIVQQYCRLYSLQYSCPISSKSS